jgi:hypothetical protein
MYFTVDVFDVYISRKNSIRVLDFNPWSPVTDSLLFSWLELVEFKLNTNQTSSSSSSSFSNESESNQSVIRPAVLPELELRIQENPGVHPTLGLSAQPVEDFLDVSTQEGLAKLIAAQKEQSKSSHSK